MQLNNTISIVIPTHNRAEGLQNLLESILIQDLPASQLQVIVVSNFGDKKTKKVIKEMEHQFYDLKFYVSGQKGCNIARNFGIRFASCDIVYFVDDDCILHKPTQLSEIISHHNNYPHASGIGGGYTDRKNKLNAAEIIYSKNANLWLKRSANEKRETHHLIGGNASYKKSVFAQGYNYNSQIKFGGSEVSLTKRLFDHGHKLLYFEELSILHDLHVSPFAILKKGFMQGKGKLTNSSDHEAKVFASHIKSIVPQQKNTVELQSKYQKVIWFLFHLMFKFGFHWSYYCRKNNISSSWWAGAFGPLHFLGQYFNLKLNTRNQKIKTGYKKQSNKLYWASKRWSNFSKKISRLTGIKAYWYTHAFFNFFYLRIKRIFHFSRLLVRKLALFIKISSTKAFHFFQRNTIFLRNRVHRLYWPLRRIYRYIAIVLILANMRLVLAKLGKYKRKIYWTILHKIRHIKKLMYPLGLKIRKSAMMIYYKLNQHIGRRLYWLPGKMKRQTRLLYYKIRKYTLTTYYKFNKYVFRRLYWLPGKAKRLTMITYYKVRKFTLASYYRFNKYVVRRVYWLPGKIKRQMVMSFYKIRKYVLAFYYKFNKYIVRRFYWLPGKIKRKIVIFYYKVRKHVFAFYYKINKYVFRRIYWLPGKTKRFCYKNLRKFKHFIVQLYWTGHKIYWLGYSLFWKVRGALGSLPWKIKAVILSFGNSIYAGNGLYWKIHPVLFKPYYFLKYQYHKRIKKRQLPKASS